MNRWCMAREHPHYCIHCGYDYNHHGRWPQLPCPKPKTWRERWNRFRGVYRRPCVAGHEEFATPLLTDNSKRKIIAALVVIATIVLSIAWVHFFGLGQ